jgi:hypothetical protein
MVDYILNKYGVSGESPIEIHKSRWTEFPILLKELGYKVGVEVGVLKGEYTKVLCKAGFEMFGIDPWVDYPTYRDYEGQNFDNFESEARRNVEGFNCNLIKGWSSDVVHDFADESLDFVFIDGNHALEYVIEDLANWSKKVRKGGIVAGHDYFRANGKNLMHVKDAVDAWTNCYKIKPWFVLTGDKCKSFFYVKT